VSGWESEWVGCWGGVSEPTMLINKLNLALSSDKAGCICFKHCMQQLLLLLSGPAYCW